MKYLENSALEDLSRKLAEREIGAQVIDGKVEAFSCKRAGEDKKLAKVLEVKVADDLSSSMLGRKSSLGDLNFTSTRRLLIDLISTLNASFPDYDFSMIQPEAFIQQSLESAVSNVNKLLGELNAAYPTFLEVLWREINQV